eukprot:scaffold57960_cov46-Tisochrysis_lutea.AAC.2
MSKGDCIALRSQSQHVCLLIQELAYGEEGLVKSGGRGIYLVKPNEKVYLDVILVDAGTGKCAAILRPPGVTERGARNLKSLSCVRNAP